MEFIIRFDYVLKGILCIWWGEEGRNEIFYLFWRGFVKCSVNVQLVMNIEAITANKEKRLKNVGISSYLLKYLSTYTYTP